MKTFGGTGVAVVTPFKQDKSIDTDALRKIINHLIDGKVEYIVTLGTTGESVTLTIDEQKLVLDTVVETVNKRIPVVCGMGGNNTQKIIDNFKSFDLSAVYGILSVSPYYNKPRQKGIFEHYAKIADKAPKPVILYNVPSRTSSNIKAETTLKLSEHPNIVAIKEASGDMEQCMEIINNKPKDFLVVSGEDAITLPLMSLGMDGVISVIANAFPYKMSEMVRSALNGDFLRARELHYELFPFIQMIFDEGNPPGIKALMSLKGLCDNELRLPLWKVSSRLIKKMKSQLGKFEVKPV